MGSRRERQFSLSNIRMSFALLCVSFLNFEAACVLLLRLVKVASAESVGCPWSRSIQFLLVLFVVSPCSGVKLNACYCQENFVTHDRSK